MTIAFSSVVMKVSSSTVAPLPFALLLLSSLKRRLEMVLSLSKIRS